MKSPMQRLVLAIVLGVQGGGPADGMQAYKEGRFADAAAAFRAALEHDGDSAELQWNLALASWRAGDLVTAETAAEKYAAMSKHARTDLHAGLLGAVRHAEAMALEQKADALGSAPPPAAAPAPGSGEQPPDPLPMLEQALVKATQAKDWFVKGAAANATPELLRNTERSLRTIDELQKKIDELKKQREQQKKEDEQKPDDENEQTRDEPKKDDKQEQKQDDKEQKAEQQPKPDEQQGDEKPEPKPGQPQDEPKEPPKDGQGAGQQPPQGEPKGQPGERHDAPGEGQQGKELTPEQAQRLLDELQKTDDKAKAIRMRAKTGRRPVERDW